MNRRKTEFQQTGRLWNLQQVREDIQGGIEFQQPILRGPIQVTQGENPVLAITGEQTYAFDALFGTHSMNIISHPHYALIETTGKDSKKLEVPVRSIPTVRTKTPNHFLISAGLARQLGVDEKTELRVLDVYQKVEDINLDKI